MRKLFGSSILIFFLFFIISALPFFWSVPILDVSYAANYLTNPSFTGGTTGWTLTAATYDSSYYQDSAGSLKTDTTVGRNKFLDGIASQSISTSINSTDTVLLSLYWSKQCVSSACRDNSIRVEIEKPSAPDVWVVVWSDTSIPAAGSATAWTGPSGLDVSSYFDESGNYNIRVYMYVRNANDNNAQSMAWVDNIILDVASSTLSVSVSDGSVSYGLLAAGAAKSTLSGDLNDMQTATNDGDVTANINVKGQDASGGGCTWALASSSGADQYVHQFCNDTDNDCSSPPTNYTALTTSYQTLKSSVSVSGTVDFQLRLTTPSSSSCYNAQSVDVTVQAASL